MKLQKGKWYVCIKSWSDDGWLKFKEGDLLKCEANDILTDGYNTDHMFLEDDEPELIFREATDLERNIASATEVDIDNFVEFVPAFPSKTTLADIYRLGAKAMLHHIREKMSIKEKE